MSTADIHIAARSQGWASSGTGSSFQSMMIPEGGNKCRQIGCGSLLHNGGRNIGNLDFFDNATWAQRWPESDLTFKIGKIGSTEPRLQLGQRDALRILD
jgi:hypothetical protein